MSHATVEPNKIASRYETHHEQLMTLYVTRQDQEFVISHDMELVDIELTRASVQLLGEPGYELPVAPYASLGHTQGAYDTAGATASDKSPNYGTTINTIHPINQTEEQWEGVQYFNGILETPELNHGWVNIDIENMTQNRQFLRDERNTGNGLSFAIATDLGLMQNRAIQAQGPANPLRLENVKMEPRLIVHSEFMGTWPTRQKRCRFVADYADRKGYRTLDNIVAYFDSGVMRFPSNLVNCIVLQFRVKPRSTI